MSNLFTRAVGHFVPSYRTVGDYAQIYAANLERSGLSAKTLENRRCYLKRLVELLGNERIGGLTVATAAIAIDKVSAVYPQTAKRVLVELRCLLREAMRAGWVTDVIAERVKLPAVRIQRSRLSFEQFLAVYAYAAKESLPWVPRMLLLAIVTGQRRGDLLKMRHSDIHSGHLHIKQQKTGTKLALPLGLRLDCIGTSLQDVVTACVRYGAPSDLLLHKSNGAPLCPASLSYRFEAVREAALPPWTGRRAPPSLHECRALAARLYQEQGNIDVVRLLGHSDYKMTKVCLSMRGLETNEYKMLRI